MRGFHRTFLTGVACRQGTLTHLDTWSCPIWDFFWGSFVGTTDAQSYITPPICDILPDLTSYLSLIWHHQFMSLSLIWLLTEFDITESTGFHGASVTGCGMPTGTLTPPDTRSCPIWDLHMFYLLRPFLFSNLSLIFWTMLFKHPSVLSQFCLDM